MEVNQRSCPAAALRQTAGAHIGRTIKSIRVRERIPDEGLHLSAANSLSFAFYLSPPIYLSFLCPARRAARRSR